MAKSVDEIISRLGITLDSYAKQVLKLLESKDNTSETELADKLKVKINTVRKSLYKLADLGFVFYTKEKDEEKKWWYVYYWSIDYKAIREAYFNHIKKELRQKTAELAAEQEFTFECKKCKVKFRYEDAMNNDFRCIKCQGVLKEINTREHIDRLAKEMAQLQKEVSE